jgi:hypothetical protein
MQIDSSQVKRTELVILTFYQKKKKGPGPDEYCVKYLNSIKILKKK